MNTRYTFAALLLLPALVTAGSGSAQGAMASENAKQVLQVFVNDFLPISAQVHAATGGWRVAAGANPGAALAKGGVALGGSARMNSQAETDGMRADVVLAAARGAVGVRNPNQIGGVLAAAGAAGALRLTGKDTPFPETARAAQDLFDYAFGAAARGGATFVKRTVSGTTFWGHSEWVDGPYGQGKIRRTRWISNFQGITRAGVGAGSGLLAAFTPIY